MSNDPPEAPEKEESKQRPRGSHHAFLAAGAAVVVLILVVILTFRGGKNGDFMGRELVDTIVHKAQHLETAQFEAVNIRAGEVSDWLLTKGFERGLIPKDLSEVNISGRTMIKNDTTPVAVLSLDDDKKRVVIFPFSSATFDLPEDGSWRFFELSATREAPRLTVAAMADKGICFAVFSAESLHDLQSWLQSRATDKH